MGYNSDHVIALGIKFTKCNEKFVFIRIKFFEGNYNLKVIKKEIKFS